MEIKCTTCGKDVAPLELYNGSWACPACHNALIDKFESFVITHDNEELYCQAEILYANWLFNHDGNADVSIIDKAVRLCRESARRGNPKAIARLAYFYDKDYVGRECSEASRFKIAYNYYSMICYSGVTGVETAPGLPTLDFTALREQTAFHMIQMLACTPPELRDNPAYNLKSNLDRIENELSITINYTVSNDAREKLSLNDRVFGVLTSTVNKQRAPLFGAFRINVGDLIEIYKKPFPGKEEKIPHALYWLTTNKKLLLAYINDKDISSSEKMFNRLSTQSSVESMVDTHDDDEYIWLFFFNNNGGHKFLNSQSKREKVQKTIFGRVGTDLLKMLLQNGNCNFYTFYDDDVYQHTKQGNLTEGTRNLVDKICNGGDDI